MAIAKTATRGAARGSCVENLLRWCYTGASMDLKHFEIRVEEFESPALAGNPLGDPHRRVVPVLVPRGTSPNGTSAQGTSLHGTSAHGTSAHGQRYPVVFVLAGYTGSGRSFLNWSAWSPSLPERIDILRDRGVIGDLIAVFPDAFTRVGGSQYINSEGTGRYEDMVAEDLVSWADSRFPTLADGRHRGILGKSSGGYGALVLGMRRPDVFSAVACHSGDMYFEYCYKTEFPRLLRQMEAHGGLEGFLAAFADAPKKTSDLVLAMNVAAMAFVYSPASGKPGGVDLPFDARTGELDEGVWARWVEHDPVRIAERHVEALRSLRCLFLDCGRRDQFHLQYGLRILSRKLESLGVPHVVEEFDDDHTDTSYRYEVSIPRVWEAIR